MANSIDRGIITRIYLENFLTYNSIVVKPGRNLNLIIGPNGTGKSTIVCAIVLGLGGKTKIIGRALQVGEYVKAGYEQAKIEIDLSGPNKSTIKIVRTFNVRNQSQWHYNNRISTAKEIEEIVKQLNIQVDNLCQFLPQDKVQDFSKMNAQELLENTERSVGDPILVEYHTKLKEYRERHRQMELEIESKSKLLETQTQKYEGLKEVVGNITERKRIKKKIKTLQQKKAWMLYDELRSELLESKKARDQAARNMKSLEEQLQPIKDEMRILQSKIGSLENACKTYDAEVSAKKTKAKGMLEAIENYTNLINDANANCLGRIQEEESREQDIKKAEQQKSKLENDLSLLSQEIGTENSLRQKQNEIYNQLEKQRNVTNNLNEQINIAKRQDDSLHNEIIAQERHLQSSGNVLNQRMEILRRVSADAYQGVLWLRENRDKFSAPVYEPMLLTIDVKIAKFAKYLEFTIPMRDLIGFVCESKEDMNLLLRYLRDEQKLLVNVLCSDPNRNVDTKPRIPIENLKHLGFQYYLISLFDAPPTIKKYVVSMYALHMIPVGTKAVDDNIDHIPQQLNRFFSENVLYTVSRSKYSGEKITNSVNVKAKNILSIVQDTAKMEKIKENLKTLSEKRNRIMQELRKAEAQLNEANKEIGDLRSAKNENGINLQKIEALRSRLRISDQKIKDLKEGECSIENIKERYKREIQGLIKKQIHNYSPYLKLTRQIEESKNKMIEDKMTYQNAKEKLEMKKNDTKDLEEKCKEAERTFKRLEEELLPLRSQTEKLLNEAKELSGNITPQDSAFKALTAAFGKLPNTIEEIDNNLRQQRTKVFILGDNADGENVLREYEKLKTGVERLKEEIQQTTENLTSTSTEIEVVKTQWLTPLQELVNRINTNFSTYFSEMNCAGEVSLDFGENPMDFAKYGLKIRVKFRDTDQLQELTRYHQSGGERAVTTAIYMIALQELSTVPFRCVDEINQGMDATNERRIFDLIVKITSIPNGSQYFLITPKLLPNLVYNDTIKVHCVYNGPQMVRHTEFDMSNYVKGIADRSKH